MDGQEQRIASNARSQRELADREGAKETHAFVSCIECLDFSRTAAEALLSENPKHGCRGLQLLERIQKLAAGVDSASSTAASARTNDITTLESHSRALVAAINARDFTNPIFALASPDFSAGIIDVFAPTNTPEAHLANFRQMADESPEYHMHLDDVSTDLEAGGEYAKVYLTVRATGRPPGLVREALGVLTWRKEEVGWRLILHESMRTFVV